MKNLLSMLWAVPLAAAAAMPANVTTADGSRLPCGENVRNFTLKAKVLSSADAEARLAFHSDGAVKGYEILFKNGPVDGSRKTGSLASVRNLYRSLGEDGRAFDFELSVREKNVEVKVNGQTVVCYTEPAKPWRSAAHRDQLLSRGDFVFYGVKGQVAFSDIVLTPLADGVTNPADTLPPVDEQADRAIRAQQRDFPVIDFHVHLKGGLTKELAHAKSLNYGINYGIAPNVGEGGVGRMLRSDAEAADYLAEVAPLPFLRGVQGEGRKWPYEFSKEQLLQFDYMFTDAMTVVDGGVPLRIYRPEEFKLNGRTQEEWMDFLVDQIEKILANEPVDVYANATYLPPPMQAKYDAYWTDARINRVLDVLAKHHIALEISANYKIPSAKIIRMAKARGIKFTFGTNNVNGDFGRLEYALDMAETCGLTKDDIWFPSMSVRASRDFRPYNTFAKKPEAGMPTGCPEFEVELPRATGGAVVRAADFGVSPTNRDNGAALNRALAHCREVGAARLVIGPGVYPCDGPKGIVLDGLKDFTLDGAGARLVFCRPSVFSVRPQYFLDSDGGNFLLKDNLRVKLQNLVIDWDWERDPLGAFVRIVDVHVDEKNDNASYFTVEFVDYDRYPYYPNPFPVQAMDGMRESRDGFQHGQYRAWWGASQGHWGPHTEWISPNRARIYPGVREPGKLFNEAYAKSYTPAVNRAAVRGAKVGMFNRLAHYYYGKNCFNLESNRHLTLEDVDIWSCRGFGFQVNGTDEYWQNIRVNLAPPRTGLARKRPYSSTADANHVARSRGHIKFIDCRTSLNQDDIHNFHDRTSCGVRRSVRTLEVTQWRRNYFFGGRVGHVVELRGDDYSPTGWQGTIVKVDGDVLTFDRDLPAADGASFILFDRHYGTDNLLIRNCRYEDYFGRLLILGSNVTVENTTFMRGTGVPINMQLSLTDTDWAEGVGTTNVVIRNCTFRDTIVTGGRIGNVYCDIYAGIAFGSEWKPLDRKPWNPILSDLLVEDCSFTNPRGYAAYFRDGRNITFRNNVIREDEKNRLAPREKGNGGVLVRSAENVSVDNNRNEIVGAVR